MPFNLVFLITNTETKLDQVGGSVSPSIAQRLRYIARDPTQSRVALPVPSLISVNDRHGSICKLNLCKILFRGVASSAGP
jgi:hypothetical protein